MFKKMTTALELMKAGKRVTNAAGFKKGQLGIDGVKAFIAATVAAYIAFTGQDITVGQETIDSASAAIVMLVPAVASLWTAISTVITTNKIGL